MLSSSSCSSPAPDGAVCMPAPALAQGASAFQRLPRLRFSRSSSSRFFSVMLITLTTIAPTAANASSQSMPRIAASITSFIGSFPPVWMVTAAVLHVALVFLALQLDRLFWLLVERRS